MKTAFAKLKSGCNIRVCAGAVVPSSNAEIIHPSMAVGGQNTRKGVPKSIDKASQPPYPHTHAHIYH